MARMSEPNVFDNPREAAQKRFAQYRVCQERGHTASGTISPPGGPTMHACKFCGTHYRVEETLVEQNVPQDPTQGERAPREPHAR
jgi:hypothetical protein